MAGYMAVSKMGNRVFLMIAGAIKSYS